ncbi:MAG: Type II/IV secretion system ATP hydrolase TadA/VirB11/CpaF, TadA subfamily [Hydrogenibacillus schlegelii]|uniref:Type II/IV secretion system ATP hydrolase TadA/VirB11/CpaF, TadA subfamily n=1 Tax=Hydrogenibacillus schlegelii TaxID=1484 RepID=A0A2T5G5X3_HYDSH|nr:ATPase, T2SS/T4P/T4SS family [Hydrogenibacillus schlegelii]PTQ51587.1 MAG: Type II/IV secretion system ATP hydrolase TadA/VirB11/CpaF, TadA subfamily [Hydrogenibacillus schlegelii]
METRDLVLAVRSGLENLPTGYSVEEYIRERLRELTGKDDEALFKDIARRTLGLGPLEDLLVDPDVSDIMVNGPNQVYVERRGRLELTPIRFSDAEELINIIYRIMQMSGRRINFSQPVEDARLPDGSRVNAVIPPASEVPLLTIRKFVQKTFSTQDLLATGSITEEMIWLFRAVVQGKANIIVAGATGSGKTTFLRWLTTFIPSHERIVVIEDTRELDIEHPHVVSLEATANAGIHRLTINALRMRPDRIIIGEVRGAEAFELLQAMGTGHEGSLTTVHANYTTREAVHRLVRAMIRIGGMTAEELEYMVTETVDLFVFLRRLQDGRRRVVRVSEIERTRDGNTERDIYVFRGGKHHFVQPVSRRLRDKLAENLDGSLPDIPAFGGGIVS